MTKGAKKGENRFLSSQNDKINSRIKRLNEIVSPKMKSMCESAYFPNKTAYQKMCAKVFNEDLPVNMECITHRTIATNAKYWQILGLIYHTYFDSENATNLASMKKNALNKLSAQEDMDKQKQENNRLSAEVNALKAYIAKAKLSQNPLPVPNLKHKPESINNLIATIDFLIKATDGIVEIDKKNRTITNLIDDINGLLSPQISNTYFQFLEGGNEFD
tara:strand:+ start:10286 stop:10939 length:654 start_codon:yes stop_codon:yes gene_type:complete